MCLKYFTHCLYRHKHSVLGFIVIRVRLPFSEVTWPLTYVRFGFYCSFHLECSFTSLQKVSSMNLFFFLASFAKPSPSTPLFYTDPVVPHRLVSEDSVHAVCSSNHLLLQLSVYLQVYFLHIFLDFEFLESQTMPFFLGFSAPEVKK